MNIRFSFYFADLDAARQNLVIETWGGHLGTAFNRAWHTVRKTTGYKDIPRLVPTSVGVAVRPTQGERYVTRMAA